MRAFPIEQAGPAHVATLKTFDPPLATLAGRRFAGAERRGNLGNGEAPATPLSKAR